MLILAVVGSIQCYIGFAVIQDLDGLWRSPKPASELEAFKSASWRSRRDNHARLHETLLVAKQLTVTLRM